MKKPKDVADLASRLAQAASTPLVLPAEAPAAPTPRKAAPAPTERKPRRAPKRTSVAVFLRLSQSLYDRFDEEAVRQTKASGRGVTVQQIILDRLEGTQA